MMRMISAYLRLFRLDAAVISFATYLVGARLAGGVRGADVLAAALITGISMNFCYSFNSWIDRSVDAINKPERPIPSGQISPRAALAYSLVLFALSLIYPFFLAKPGVALFCFLLLPVLGLMYSARPLALKFRPPLSVVAVSMGLTIPIVAGYFSNADDCSLNGFFACLFLYCLSIIPLKDIEDTRGDGKWNLYSKYGKSLPDYALTGLFANVILITVADVPDLLRGGMAVLFSATALCIVWHKAHPKQMGKLYKRIIHIVEASGVVFFAWQVLLNRMALA